ncbi:MAG TPA: PAS domain S-box protein, partial [Candidatus Dormibacteraeota bacterium]|nr:PAS domain S-box protein [Candidatus Dormibacteraeota bacterium]
MALALQIQQWAAGGAFVLLGLLTVAHSIRHGGGSRRYLALSVGLLGAVALVRQLEDVTGGRYLALTDLATTAFLASGWAFLMFRHTVLPLPRRVLTAATALVVVTALLVVAAALPSGTAVSVTVPQLLATLLFGVVWLGCVAEPVVRLYRLSFGLPRVQRARLRALTGGYAVIVLILVLSVVAAYSEDNIVLGLVVSSLTVVSAPLLYVGFAPPQWLRRIWRSAEELRFRTAVNDLLLYTPDRLTLSQRALEWGIRLVGAEGGVLATADGAVLVTQNMDQSSAWELLRDLPDTTSTRGVIAPLGGTTSGVIALPLTSSVGTGVLAVTAGPLTPVFGEDEVDRLRQYVAAITTALDRVQLVERLQRNVELLDLAYDAIFTWDIRSRSIKFWNRAAEDIYGYTAAEAVGRDPQELLRTETSIPRDEVMAHLHSFGRW